jgi:hypothetical protein
VIKKLSLKDDEYLIIQVPHSYKRYVPEMRSGFKTLLGEKHKRVLFIAADKEIKMTTIQIDELLSQVAEKEMLTESN